MIKMKKYIGNNVTVQMINYERTIKSLVEEKADLHDQEVSCKHFEHDG
jgi:hypothetical protein